MKPTMKIENKSEKISVQRGKNGGARVGAGRKPGQRNKKTAELIKSVEESGETPMQYMLRIMRDKTADHNRRDHMAVAAAPYLHARLANLTHSGEINLKTWSDEQVAIARAVFIAIAADNLD